MISGFSIISAAILYSCMLILVSLLRHFTPFLRRGGVSALLLLSGAATLRLILPFEIPVAYTYQSWNILGGLQIFLRTHTTATKIFLAVWGIGAVIFVGWNVFDLYRAHKRCLDYTVVESELVQELARRNSIPCPVVVSPDVEVPYVAGFLHHTIYLPVLDIQENKLELALLHEAQHIKNHDALIKLSFGIVMIAMWWNPIIYLFWREFDTLLELRCDAKVTAGMSRDERTEYVAMLQDIAKIVVNGRRRPVLALDEFPAVRKKDDRLVQRAAVLFDEDKPLRLPNLRPVAQCVVLVLFCMSYLVVFQAAGLAPAENFQDDARTYYKEDYDSFDVGDKAKMLIIQGADGRYRLFINYEFSRYLTEDEVASDKYKNLLILEENIQE